MRYFRFWVEGDPVGKQRPRFTGTGRTYTPAKTKAYECLVRDLYLMDVGAEYYFDQGEGVYVHADIFLPIPKSVSKKVREKMLAREYLPLRKPDADNVLKAILDGLVGAAMHDDSQVVSATSRKFYGEKPGVMVYLSGEPLCKYFFEDE